MADLPTNYLDDILAQSMNGKRKYRITRADGTFEEVTLEDVSEYEQVGSNFGAGDINKTNQAVNEKFDSGDVVDPMLTTEPGFAADAYQTKLQFDEQNKNIGIIKIWENPESTAPEANASYNLLDSLSNYDFIMMVYTYSSWSKSVIIPSTSQKGIMDIVHSGVDKHFSREFVIDYSNNKISFIGGAVSPGNADNTSIVPRVLYGIRCFKIIN